LPCRGSEKLRCCFACSARGYSANIRGLIPSALLLLSSNEVPAVKQTASGVATVWTHVIFDSSGQILSGSVDFHLIYYLSPGTKITGVNIHRGPAGADGPAVITTDVTPSALDRSDRESGHPRPAGAGSFRRPDRNRRLEGHTE
jgi:CHRD domain